MNPRSLANLRPPIKPGEVRNPEGKNGDGLYRPYTAAMEWFSAAKLHEHLRVALNVRFQSQLYAQLKDHPDFKELLPEDIPELYPKGITWAQANAVRMHVAAVLEGEIMAAVECRESVEGRATTRIEFTSQNDKLESLLEAFRAVARQPAVIDVPVLPASIPSSGNGSGNGSGNT
jgi:hypothetical protein